ncbi:MAG: hypothetical protein F2690_00680 [Actinobacteria bacterium]|uniref:Unannotated protein n=1 Tax=freshwater metagenome TaxID=449393 RepID=A0A6J5YTU0_9ZZZZ|nr:hypothetical protein [Actinomycetota bacterium]MSX71570.1 hypothetical protein [Actinomycetota bacterium]MSY69074.1 hypothetical protein [Actinomycetota bacterium]MTA75515.1 hypothetical protein [Actinomycetota bacterium]
MSYFSEPEKKPIPLRIGLLIIALVAVGATYASNISINGSNRIEFGQGVYAVEACNGWVQIQIPTVSPDASGYSPITGFLIDGVDPDQCRSTLLHFKAFSNLSSEPIPLFSSTDPATPETTFFQVSLNVDEYGSIQLVDDNGTPIEESLDEFGAPIPGAPIAFSIDPDTRRITVDFSLYPQSHWPDLYSLTIESGPNNVAASEG